MPDAENDGELFEAVKLFAGAARVEDYSTDCIAHRILPAYQLGNG